MFKTIMPPEKNPNTDIECKFLAIETKDKDFKKIFDFASKNMFHYFSMYFNTKEKVHNAFKKNNAQWSDFKVCGYVPDKDDAVEVSDVKNQNSLMYKNFIENLVRKAHLRSNLTFVNYIPEKHKKAELVSSYFFEKPEISITYFTSPIMLCMNFNKESLNIVYMLNHHNNEKFMLDINIDHNNKIVSTEASFNGVKSNEIELISLNHKQLDYLIVLSHYADGEEIDFIAEKYVDDILAENYQDLLDYIKVKEMTYI